MSLYEYLFLLKVHLNPLNPILISCTLLIDKLNVCVKHLKLNKLMSCLINHNFLGWDVRYVNLLW